VSILTNVRKYLICELELKNYIYNKCSRLNSSHHGSPNLFEDTWVLADSLRDIHNAMMKCLFVFNSSCIHKGFFGVPIGKCSEDSSLGSVEAMHLFIGVIGNISHRTAKMFRSTIMHVTHSCSDCQWYIFQ
jgi:hypothetical protein